MWIRDPQGAVAYCVGVTVAQTWGPMYRNLLGGMDVYICIYIYRWICIGDA